jgi:uncharacterized protein
LGRGSFKQTGFDWDDGNARKNEEKHGVSMSESEQVFFNAQLLMLQDAAHSHAEPRLHALCRTDEGSLAAGKAAQSLNK